ncbi:hypothetical protein Csa_009482 [Cucumis sativus]|uniref:Uncharacterized protein n=1 Tax=Cucumis sativus TaxID=3659 RepID=A0A0A0LDA6_CUCSA|nr:hypothetical protein Csa_009482 [Cucumis sativus]
MSSLLSSLEKHHLISCWDHLIRLLPASSSNPLRFFPLLSTQIDHPCCSPENDNEEYATYVVTLRGEMLQVDPKWRNHQYIYSMRVAIH